LVLLGDIGILCGAISRNFCIHSGTAGEASTFAFPSASCGCFHCWDRDRGFLGQPTRNYSSSIKRVIRLFRSRVLRGFNSAWSHGFPFIHATDKDTSLIFIPTLRWLKLRCWYGRLRLSSWLPFLLQEGEGLLTTTLSSRRCRSRYFVVFINGISSTVEFSIDVILDWLWCLSWHCGYSIRGFSKSAEASVKEKASVGSFSRGSGNFSERLQ
jgi:hypothetical protein